jgi:hypothetical protein
MKVIYVRDESSDRVTRVKLANISVSCLRMSLAQAGSADDLDAYGRSEGKMRDIFSPISSGISFAPPLALSLYPETRE